MDQALTVEAGTESVTGHCDGCGHETRVFRGFVYNSGHAYGIYAGIYTQSHPELGVSMAISLRGWGEGADIMDKECVVLEWHVGETGPGCAVVEAPQSSWSAENFFGRMLTREEAISSGRAGEAIAVTDVVWFADARLADALALRQSAKKKRSLLTVHDGTEALAAAGRRDTGASCLVRR